MADAIKAIQSKQMIKSKKKHKLSSYDKETYLFVLFLLGPPFLGYLIFSLLPNLLSVFYSFFYWDGVAKPIFIGFDNYIKFFTDENVKIGFINNIILLVTVPILTTLIAVVLAFVISSHHHIENKLHEIIYFVPNVLSGVVITLIWSLNYEGYFGLLNNFLKFIGIDMNNYYWLADTKTALYALIPVFLWSGVGYYFIIFYNAIRSIPKSYYEYATLEGASSFTKLRKITVPFISSVIKIVFVLQMLGALKGYETILLMTHGGPGNKTMVLGLLMFEYAFPTSVSSFSTNFGYASTIGIMLAIFLIILKALFDRIFKAEDVQY